MAFDGVYPAPKIEPTEYGLLRVAKPDIQSDLMLRDKWTRGFYQMYDTQPNYVRAWDETSSTSFTLSSNPDSPLYQTVKPIFLEVEEQRSTFGLTGDDRFARIMRQMEAITQKTLEYEFWNGEIALAEGLPNMFLAKPGVTVIGGGTAYSAKRALALMEHYAGEMSPAGEHGILHLTRDAFILMSSNSNMFIHSEDDDRMETTTGTPVVIGSGYSGDGPHILINTIAVSGNTVTVVTTTDHYFTNNESVEISAVVGVTNFSGTYTVTRVNATTFTFSKTTGDIGATAPTGTATAQMKGSDSTKWVYCTGHVDVHLGKIEVVNERLGQGYDVSGNQNDIKMKGLRPAAAYFDPSIHLAVKVDLTV
jgi:hypothetical protein